jgi:hypothetical protein
MQHATVPISITAALVLDAVQAPGSRSSWCSHHPSSPGGLRDAYASPCSSTEPALPDQPQQRPGGISRKWGDLRTLTDASETKSVAELYSMIGCKPPVHPPLGGPADKGAPSSSSSSSRRRGGVGGQLAADVVTTAAPTTKQQQQQQGVVLDRRAQLAAVAALEQQAASSWQQATGTRWVLGGSACLTAASATSVQAYCPPAVGVLASGLCARIQTACTHTPSGGTVLSLVLLLVALPCHAGPKPHVLPALPQQPQQQPGRRPQHGMQTMAVPPFSCTCSSTSTSSGRQPQVLLQQQQPMLT